MAHVTLIKPPTVVNMSSLSFYNTLPPLGLAYVSAAAKAAGHRVHVVDAPGEAIETYHPRRQGAVLLHTHGLSLPEIVARVDPESSVIGISQMFLHEWPLVRELVQRLRARWPDKRIVLGGETPTAFWWRMLDECPELDVCVLGEGEETFVALLDALDAGAPPGEVAGIACRDAEGRPVRSTGARKRIRAVAALPRPDWEAFRVDAYLAHGYSSGVKRGRSLPMLSSRGCPYQCTFCSSPAMWTTRYVARPPEDVADEIAQAIARYGITNVDFHDLTAFLTKSWILRFCAAIAERGLELSFQLPSGTRCEALDAESLAALRRAGCRNLSYSPESGSPELLDEIRKRIELPELLRSVRAAVAAGIVTNVNFIVGLPGETRRQRLETCGLLARLALAGAHSTAVMVFTPYPGSALFDRLFAEGRLALDDELYLGSLLRSGRSARSYNERTGPRALVAWQLAMLAGFFALQYARRPGRLFGLLRRFAARGAQETNVEQFLDTRRLYARKRREAAARADAPDAAAAPPAEAVRAQLDAATSSAIVSSSTPASASTAAVSAPRRGAGVS